MNVAVGGTGGYFGSWIQHPPYPKPWNDDSELAMREFWEARNLWEPTWGKVSTFLFLQQTKTIPFE